MQFTFHEPQYKDVTIEPTWNTSSSMCGPLEELMMFLWEVMSSSSHSPMVVITCLEYFVMFSAVFPRKISMSVAGERRTEHRYKAESDTSADPCYIVHQQ